MPVLPARNLFMLLPACEFMFLPIWIYDGMLTNALDSARLICFAFMLFVSSFIEKGQCYLTHCEAQILDPPDSVSWVQVCSPGLAVLVLKNSSLE